MLERPNQLRITELTQSAGPAGELPVRDPGTPEPWLPEAIELMRRLDADRRSAIMGLVREIVCAKTANKGLGQARNLRQA